jgi:adenylate kinase
MRIALFGPPGAGKGTQARLLSERRDLRSLSTGVIIRQAIEAETPVGQKAKPFVDAGELVPDEVMRPLAEEAIAAEDFTDFILDGYPRTLQQAEWLTAFLEDHGAPLTAVVALDVPDEKIVDRLSKRRVHKETGENFHLEAKPPSAETDPALIVQRPDDRPEAIRKRLAVYHEETAPVRAYYERRSESAYHRIDGTGDFEDVYDRLDAVLEETANVKV